VILLPDIFARSLPERPQKSPITPLEIWNYHPDYTQSVPYHTPSPKQL